MLSSLPSPKAFPRSCTAAPSGVVAWLVDELVELGHDVTLFASGDSRTKGKLHPVWPRALRLGQKGAWTPMRPVPCCWRPSPRKTSTWFTHTSTGCRFRCSAGSAYPS